MASPSPHFPSELKFGSFLIYPSPAVSDLEKKAKTFILDLKRNAVFKSGSAVEIAVSHLAKAVKGSCLEDLLDGTSILVPMPGSAPLLKNAVWANRTICESMVSAGLGKEVRPYIERIKPIRKSAYCAMHGISRPLPCEHYETIGVKPMLGPASDFVLVDDVITRGSTFVAAAAYLQQVFPAATVRAFAVAHTESGMVNFFAPCHGLIHSNDAGDWVSRSNID